MLRICFAGLPSAENKRPVDSRSLQNTVKRQALRPSTNWRQTHGTYAPSSS